MRESCAWLVLQLLKPKFASVHYLVPRLVCEPEVVCLHSLLWIGRQEGVWDQRRPNLKWTVHVEKISKTTCQG